MSRTVWRIFGIEVFSRESDEETVEEPLTAGDNGGDLRSERIDVPPIGFVDQWEKGWER